MTLSLNIGLYGIGIVVAVVDLFLEILCWLLGSHFLRQPFDLQKKQCGLNSRTYCVVF